MRTTVPQFFKQLCLPIDISSPSLSFENFCTAIDYLHSVHSSYQELAIRCVYLQRGTSPPIDPIDEIYKWFRGALLAQLPVNVDLFVHAYFDYAFRVFSGTVSTSSSAGGDQNDGEMSGELKDEFACHICEADTFGCCKCPSVLTAFRQTNEKLSAMSILDRLCGPTIAHLVEDKIKLHTAEMCQGMLRSNSNLLENWLERVVLEWIRMVYLENDGCAAATISTGGPEKQKRLQQFRAFQQKLEHFLCETYARILIDQFFNIIIEYPDSGPAIDDLRLCLKRTDLRSHLMETIKRCLEQRMLHPGVDTNDILTGYVATIKVLRHLDPSGVLLEAIIEPAKEYLRSRQDTVRCVITSLIEDEASDLTEELARSELVGAKPAANSAAHEMLNWEQWEPDPVDAAPPKETTKTDRSADIISMVVDIYGSKELFVKEYWNLLAKRLLLSLDLNTDKEIRNLELLKLRFGEAVLHRCEVMLKDISDSKRINAHVQCDSGYLEQKSFEMSTLILSSQFWPAFNKETLELPPEIQKQFESYTKSYEAHKGNRSLLWWPTNGKVTLEVELGGRTMEFTVPPTQATILHHFERQSQWTLQDLAAQMKVTPVLLRKKIAFWLGKGLIRETASQDEFKLVEETEEVAGMSSATNLPVPVEDEEDGDNLIESANDQREEALQVFWSYIVGMLTNLESLPLERIHQMLKMFASHGPGVEFSQQELRSFLQKKVQTQKLVYVAGVYQLPK